MTAAQRTDDALSPAPISENEAYCRRRIIAALILRALVDAAGGDQAAIDWMDRQAPWLARRWLHMSASKVANWRAAAKRWRECQIQTARGPEDDAGPALPAERPGSSA